MKKDKRPFHSIRKPNFLGNGKAFMEFLAKNLVYPKEALDNKKQGIAHVKCGIGDNGKVLTAKSIHPLGFGLDEEAERLCQLMRFENTTERGLKIKHTKTIKIPFVLPPAPPAISFNYETTPSKKESEQAKKQGGGYSYTVEL